MKKLTKKQEIFAKEYVKLDDASAAYRIAYSTSRMKDKTVNEKASRLLKEGKVRARVNELQKVAAEIAEKDFKIDSKELLGHLNILRKSRIDEYVDFVEFEMTIGIDEETGEPIKKSERVLQFKPFSNLTEEQLMCIESIKEGRNGIELKLHGKDWTIEKIAKHIGFYEKDNEQSNPKPEREDLSKLSLKELKTLQALKMKAKG
ncbi:terminase small subunit [Salinimicrobium sp. GXAS 041]|uniref:terminase small subunit n=1 Tax=Salinimicrobium sp. GXAS 041 TaxID=3400806 RepID=UPI003C7647D7